ncbi:pseudouridine synthase [Xylaria bambusicola]|uniref:pseudouridine synthase n=1 Tax=Xylaria bambusicola TaxID=326684 RepID=UPI002008B0B3|nr:pseudouridine synthase [Xylaria bambusicola]KAI0526419.1 pseudouridine synthase [Xylaria bambusicola]
MAAEIDSIDRPGRHDFPATQTSSNEPTSTPTAATSVDSDANKSRDRNGQRHNGQFRGGKRGDRGRGGKRTRDFGRNERNKGADNGKDSVDWRDRKRRKFERDEESGRNSGPSYMKIQFPEDEIAAEERRPKRKVAVLIGYAGTGYHGLQINHDLKTIEGDLFAAFVAAKAISKANANDPKKSSFVRCARTDKGVHAAGNMVSLKLIIEDPDIVQKINENLPPQIRVWGIQRTNNAFSCYASCDSRWYEYLMPSYCLLPPHPESFLGRKVLQSLKENGLEDEYAERMGEAKDYWDDVDKTYIQPILDNLDPDVREVVKQRIHSPDRDTEQASGSQTDATKTSGKTDSSAANDPKTSEGEISVTDTRAVDSEATNAMDTDDVKAAAKVTTEEATVLQSKGQPKIKEQSPVEKALKEIKAAYIAAKRRYRVTPDRLEQLQKSLDHYLGTKNYHNYTILKSHGDPSSKRTIKSFVVNREPIQINDTQWLSLKVHGQSFMMHQIRKMVGMAVLAVRCATPWSRFEESYSASRISIPKAPSLGLLLERPVFDTYNKRATESLNLEALSFSNHEKEIQAFKEEHIYRRIFELEEQENAFHLFFNQIDTFRSDYFLWVTSGNLEGLYQREGPGDSVPKELENELGDEGENPGGEEG